MNIIQYTTPSLTFLIPGKDLRSTNVNVRFVQHIDGSLSTHVVDVTVSSGNISYANSSTTITVPLTQLQTGGFEPGPVEVQADWITSGGNREATFVSVISMNRNLYDEVRTYA